MLIAPEADPDAPDIPTPRSYVEAIEGPYSSQWQSAMEAEMASWKSTGTYVDEVPPPWANIVSGMWIFRVKRPPGSPPVFKARYVARGFSQRQGVDYFQTFSPTPKMTTLRPARGDLAAPPTWLHWVVSSWYPGPVYGLRQAAREWHDTLRTTLAALGFAPSTADLSLFLRTDTSLPLFYILVYVDDLVFATADTAGLAHVKSELQKRHTCTDLGELSSYLGLQITRDRAQRTITLTQSHMVQQVLQRFDFTYSSPQATPLSTRHSLSALPSDESYVRLGLVLGGRRPVVLTGYADASWADDQATQRSSQGYTFSLGSGSVSWRSTRSSSVLGSSCEADIYAGAMAAQELRWRTYLLADLGEPPCSPPVLYVDNKAMLALCREHRLEHRTKHIPLRYFLARELQQRGQLRLAYVASEANTADIFTKALPPGDLQHFCTMLACFDLLDWTLTRSLLLTYPSFGKPKVVRARSVAEQCDEEEIAQCYWAAVPEPKMLAEALSGPDAEKWKQSVKEEYDSLLENETWELCELPPGKKAISSKLIFRHKYGPDGELTRYKSSFVAKGFQQIKGKDFDEIFAPVGKGTTLRCSKMGDVKYYLGMHVERDLDKGVLRLHQRKYCEGLAEKYGLQDGGKPATPLPSGFTEEPCADEEVVGESDRKLFHSMVGALNYAANHTRPDIAFATSRLASVVSRPNHEQLEAAKRLVCHVSAMASVGLEYSAVRQRLQRGAADLGKGEMLLTCYTDASFNSIKADGTSIGGYVCLFGGGAVSWRSKKQNEVGQSSCET
ncbi:unnamed protein product [Closterium sp. NIES-53]